MGSSPSRPVRAAYESVRGEDDPNRARILLDLASALLRQGEHEPAEELARTALLSLSDSLPAGHRDITSARALLATVLLSRGQATEARGLLEHVLEDRLRTTSAGDARRINAHGALAAAIAAEAAALRANSADPAADARLRRAFVEQTAAFVAAQRARVQVTIPDASPREAEERIASGRDALSRALSFAAGAGVFPGDAALEESAWILSAESRSSAIATARIARAAHADPAHAALQEQLRRASAELARAARSGATNAELDAARLALDKTGRELVRTASRLPGAELELLVEEPALAGEPRLLAIGHPAFDSAPADPEEEGAVGRELQAATRGTASAPRRGRAWERAFATLPATRGEVRAVAEYFSEAFDADGAASGSRAQVLERKQASRENFLAQAPGARWLHVATHGWFASESVRSFDDVPLDRASLLSEHDPELRVRGTSPLVLCGLALSGANLPMDAAGRQPGLVTAQEIAALDLSCCELAVLSACDTNVGVRRAGQGVASLQRALHMAGARSTITSLWRVPDEATRELMTDFYRRMWIEHTPKAEALWAAKKRLRDARDEDGRPKYEPRDWAGWILSGDPR